MSEAAEMRRARLTSLAGPGWFSVSVVPACSRSTLSAAIKGIVGIGFQHRDTRIRARCPALAGVPLPLASPVGQSEAATAQSSSATAVSAQASALSTKSVAPASR
jgi:hypothetical protein